MITKAQCRAARAWLGINQLELASRAGVGVSTIRDFETGARTPIANNLKAIQEAFRQAGITMRFDNDGAATGLEVDPGQVRG